MQEPEDREPLSPRTLLRRLRDWTRQELSVPGEADLEVDEGPATPDPMAGLVTREDLAALATREDLAGLATREDVERAVSGAVDSLSGALARLTEVASALPSTVGAAADRLGDRIDAVRVDVE